MSDFSPDGTTCGPWATDEDLAIVGCDDQLGDMDVWLQAATDMLFVRTGRQWIGECTVTIRPCGAGHPGCPPGILNRNLDRFEWWWNGWGCGCDDGMCDAGPGMFRLPGSQPVISVDEVTINGETLAPSEYRVDDWRVLVRIGGVWPRCQNLRADITDPGTWAVTYTFGSQPPTAGRLAAAAWACHLAQMAAPGDGCVLPAGVESLSRQSVDLVMSSASEILDAGRTGIELVDQFIVGTNPLGKSGRARFRDPDAPRYAVTQDGSGS
jgi:hypothetical protein